MADVVVNLEKRILNLARANAVLSKKTKVTEEDLQKFARASKQVEKEFAKAAKLLKTGQVTVGHLTKAFKKYSSVLNQNERATAKAKEQLKKKTKALEENQKQTLDLLKRDREWAAQQKKNAQQQELDIIAWKTEKS